MSLINKIKYTKNAQCLVLAFFIASVSLSDIMAEEIQDSSSTTPASPSLSKRDCRLMLTTIVGYGALGVWSIGTAYNRLGSSFVYESFMKIVDDPIYIYAVADLGAIFTVASIYTYRDTKRRGLRAWTWIPSYFVFGTPAFLMYLLHASKHSPKP